MADVYFLNDGEILSTCTPVATIEISKIISAFGMDKLSSLHNAENATIVNNSDFPRQRVFLKINHNESQFFPNKESNIFILDNISSCEFKSELGM